VPSISRLPRDVSIEGSPVPSETESFGFLLPSASSCPLPLQFFCNWTHSSSPLQPLYCSSHLLPLPSSRAPQLARRSRSSSAWSIDPQLTTTPQHFYLESSPPCHLELSPGLQVWVFGTHAKTEAYLALPARTAPTDTCQVGSRPGRRAWGFSVVGVVKGSAESFWRLKGYHPG